jgi:phosphoglycerol transferase MdoB-like AlkP superfamily enzyme
MYKKNTWSFVLFLEVLDMGERGESHKNNTSMSRMEQSSPSCFSFMIINSLIAFIHCLLCIVSFWLICCSSSLTLISSVLTCLELLEVVEESSRCFGLLSDITTEDSSLSLLFGVVVVLVVVELRFIGDDVSLFSFVVVVLVVVVLVVVVLVGVELKVKFSSTKNVSPVNVGYERTMGVPNISK